MASSPEGPWTAPVDVTLPGCNDFVGSQQKKCYAGSYQPAFDSNGRLGLGYFDQASTADPTRGRYMVTNVPLTVTP